MVASEGIYEIIYTYTDSNGCSSIISTTIEVIENSVNAGPDVSIFEAGQITLNAVGGVTFLWEPPDGLSCTGCPDPVSSPFQTTTYTVTSYDDYGCVATDDVTVTVIPVFDSTVFVPNTFTPNGDNLNDYLFAFGTDIVMIQSLNIFDRWGELIWRRENLLPNETTAGWDGSARGFQVDSGVYTYFIEAELTNGAIILAKGNVTLVK